MLLGAVGAYDWNGTVVMHTAAGTIVPGKTQFYDPNTEAGYEGLAGYLGELTSNVLKALKTYFPNQLFIVSDRVLHEPQMYHWKWIERSQISCRAGGAVPLNKSMAQIHDLFW